MECGDFGQPLLCFLANHTISLRLNPAHSPYIFGAFTKVGESKHFGKHRLFMRGMNSLQKLIISGFRWPNAVTLSPVPIRGLVNVSMVIELRNFQLVVHRFLSFLVVLYDKTLNLFWNEHSKFTRSKNI